MPLTLDNGADTAHVATAGDHDEVSSVELDKVDNLVLLEVKLDSVVDLDERVGVTDGATVVGDDERNASSTELNLLDLQEFVRSFVFGDAVDGESTLDVVQETEVLARLFDRDHVLEAGRVSFVGSDFVVDLDQSLLDDQANFSATEGILQAAAKEDLSRE